MQSDCCTTEYIISHLLNNLPVVCFIGLHTDGWSINYWCCVIESVCLAKCLLCVSQEWDKKAEEAKKQYVKAMKEYKESGGGAGAASVTKWADYLQISNTLFVSVQKCFLRSKMILCIVNHLYKLDIKF